MLKDNVVGHIVGCWLPRSETFIYDLVRNIDCRSYHVFTGRTENLDLFPCDRLHVCDSEDAYLAAARSLGIDVLVCHFGPNGIAGLQVALACDIPVATIFHGYDVSMLLLQPRWVERYRTYFRFGGRAICVSDVGRQRLMAIGCPPKHARTIHSGIDVSRFAPRSESCRPAGQIPTALVVARMTEKKGLDVALHALRRLIDSGRRLQLRVVGYGEQHDQLVHLRRALGLEDDAVFVGPLDSAGVQREMSRADMVWQPSVTAADGDQEGIPGALMEAMACSVPVIATRHSGIPEMVRHEETGLLVDEKDACGLAAAANRLIEHPDLARSLARAGRTMVEREFNLAIQPKRVASFLREALDERADRREHRARAQSAPSLLYIRSVPVPQALTQLSLLCDRYPGRTIAVLTDEATRDVFHNCRIVSDVYTHPGGRMCAVTTPDSLVDAIRSACFEEVIVPFTNMDGAGYENVIELAFSFSEGSVTGLTVSHLEMALERIAGVTENACYGLPATPTAGGA